MHDLTGKVALITGAGCRGEGWGNGQAIATLFARQGARIFGCDLDMEAADNTRQRILSENAAADVTMMLADASQRKSMEELVEACMKKHGRIDILVNNVGVGGRGDPVSMPEEVWDQQMNVNLKSVYLTCHLVMGIMEKQEGGGSVVNISSIAGLRHLGVDTIGYATAKGAVLSFSRSAALSFAKRGVRVNAVIPGMMDTPLLRNVGPDYQALREKRNKACPMGFMGTAWDIAHAVLFLASGEARYITGTEILVDGGVTQAAAQAV